MAAAEDDLDDRKNAKDTTASSFSPSPDLKGDGCGEADEWTAATSTGSGTAPGDSQQGQALPPVQVCVRLRPLLDWEVADGQGSSALQVDSRRAVVTLLPRESSEASREQAGQGEGTGGPHAAKTSAPRKFGFNAVVGHDGSQLDVWKQARLSELVGKVVAGFHATVFAYGQTGTGKTFTMEGFSYELGGFGGANTDARGPRACSRNTQPEQFGVVPRAVRELFSRVEAEEASTSTKEGVEQEHYSIKVSFMQIYKERIFDLLNPAPPAPFGHPRQGEDGGSLRLRWDAAKGLFTVENLFEYECSSFESVLEHYSAGVRNKQVASTAMNAASSRSHTILLLTLTHRTELTADDESSLEDGGVPTREVVSNLALVDLAGSERASASSACENSSARLKEASTINQSLFVLRRVITALSKRNEDPQDSGHVPYRDSKLTSLLQHAIGGSGFMLMLACLSPADRHYEENLSTLRYATQAACIKNRPAVNLDPKDRLIQELRQQLAAAHEYILRHLGLKELPAELLQIPKSSGQRAKEAMADQQRQRSRSVVPVPPAAEAASNTSTFSTDVDERDGPSHEEQTVESRRRADEVDCPDLPRLSTSGRRASRSREPRPPLPCRRPQQSAPTPRSYGLAAEGSGARQRHRPPAPAHDQQQQPLELQPQHLQQAQASKTGLPPIASKPPVPRQPDLLAVRPDLSVYCEASPQRRRTPGRRSASTGTLPTLVRRSSPRALGGRCASTSALACADGTSGHHMARRDSEAGAPDAPGPWGEAPRGDWRAGEAQQGSHERGLEGAIAA